MYKKKRKLKKWKRGGLSQYPFGGSAPGDSAPNGKRVFKSKEEADAYISSLNKNAHTGQRSYIFNNEVQQAEANPKYTQPYLEKRADLLNQFQNQENVPAPMRIQAPVYPNSVYGYRRGGLAQYQKAGNVRIAPAPGPLNYDVPNPNADPTYPNTNRFDNSYLPSSTTPRVDPYAYKKQANYHPKDDMSLEEYKNASHAERVIDSQKVYRNPRYRADLVTIEKGNRDALGGTGEFFSQRPGQVISPQVRHNTYNTTNDNYLNDAGVSIPNLLGSKKELRQSFKAGDMTRKQFRNAKRALRGFQKGGVVTRNQLLDQLREAKQEDSNYQYDRTYDPNTGANNLLRVINPNSRVDSIQGELNNYPSSTNLPPVGYRFRQQIIPEEFKKMLQQKNRDRLSNMKNYQTGGQVDTESVLPPVQNVDTDEAYLNGRRSFLNNDGHSQYPYDNREAELQAWMQGREDLNKAYAPASPLDKLKMIRTMAIDESQLQEKQMGGMVNPYEMGGMVNPYEMGGMVNPYMMGGPVMAGLPAVRPTLERGGMSNYNPYKGTPKRVTKKKKKTTSTNTREYARNRVKRDSRPDRWYPADNMKKGVNLKNKLTTSGNRFRPDPFNSKPTKPAPYNRSVPEFLWGTPNIKPINY